ncbi:DMT family transporter [Thalassobius sp. Cn5-15]|uniref:DMT family transporter n=1 Tax=Thalassobius sp. Cn5-15 TaxID=2917763 RepID=UPI001EF2ABED|nr:DMT family transporter [Thalassobius sp. Cn5-15]MCG7492322.1 DMT family transporter [Thalassobius sp. Cn5-15]
MNNLQSIILMVVSMLFFAIEDLFLKQLTAVMPVGQVIALLGAGGAFMFGLMARRKGEQLFPRGAGTAVLYWRTAAEGLGSIFIVGALALVPLTTFSTVFQASPLVITLGAALFLGETVGWRRWSAIAVGFLGVLLIIRPGTTAFDPATLLVLGAVVMISVRDVISRRLPKDTPSTVVSFQGFGSLVISGPLLMLGLGDLPVMVSSHNWGIMALTVSVGMAGYYAIVMATRIGDASALAPFRYSRMVFSMTLGILILGERPEMMTYVGAALIIGSGFYTYIRERRLLRRAAPTA